MSFTSPGDLAPLFAQPSPGLPVTQGRLTAFNADTLANTVEVTGQPLTDLAVLHDAISSLAAGRTVLLVALGKEYVIAGRLRTPPEQEETDA
ncbi:hypothetical protein Ae168Ps1_6390c [Pseudonocardia sp. Ae168_Ps1]|uniref:hypothetical protein n=1 Tax=unclassified Pseudonocardia TaxID=2619320 RepID=UPI00094AAD15|nr:MULTISPECIES: hypothetical protein [unclassified Pseudonocardia]OLL69833.1 hypothetical protein Ae150APs1_6244c [Pseudonocardia sp. Ae150A_Ps1]OLL69965.1 hypothetical protein Ae168Ps1_6390c [Pseudonocardia sp. Ae168_Ps1]OLL89126.1 hypothetical protein Ae356Ps1_6243c [Pseudonocardia sp. Ae356_Ps1]